MKRRTRTWKLLSVMLVLCLSLTGLVYAGEESTEAPAEPETVVAAPLQLKTLGQESEDAYQIKITNNTGYDIEYVGISFYNPELELFDLVYEMQEALIKAGYLEGEADGSAGPLTQEAIAAYREANGLPAEGGADTEMLEKLLGVGYDGNIMTKGDLFTAGETRILYVPKTKPAEEGKETSEQAGAAAEGEETPDLVVAGAEGEETSEQAVDSLAEALKEFSVTPEYVLSFRSQGSTQNHYLFAFPASVMQTAQLNLDGQIPYVMYTTAGSPDPISTLDAEKVADRIFFSGGKNQAVNSSTADQGYDQSWDTGYDQSYDYGYDTGYAEPAYEEPAYDAPYVVTEEYYPSCDDGSHGVIYRVWSDGTEERIDY